MFYSFYNKTRLAILNTMIEIKYLIRSNFRLFVCHTKGHDWKADKYTSTYDPDQGWRPAKICKRCLNTESTV